jgi:PAS domain S-box-containing protein
VSAADRARFTVADQVRGRIDANATSRRPSTKLDVRVELAADDLPGLTNLQQVFDEAEQLAGAGQLMTRPALPEIQQLRAWYTNELLRQHAGLPPTPWRLSESTALDNDASDLAVPPELAWVTTAAEAVIAAGEDARIVAMSPSVEEVIGWRPAALLGQRIAVLVPIELRESHIAGFSRQVLNGRAHVLNQQLQLPAICGDGRRQDVMLQLGAHATSAGRYFTATISRADTIEAPD